MKLSLTSPKLSVAIFAAAALFSGAVSAQVADPTLIDRELARGIDFRSKDFEGCLGKPSCTVNGLTISAERQTDDGLDWVPATLYWDPVDGFGILDGAQNDEIDIDERVTVVFNNGAEPLGKIWLSDLFLGEEARYSAAGNNKVELVPDDVEVAGVGLWSAGIEQSRFNITGKVEMPDKSFNQYVSESFLEDGDLRRRLLINNNIITVLAAGEGTGDNAIEISKVIGQVDAEKRRIFEGIETIEIDLSTILAGFRGTIMFLEGTRNFDMIKRLSENPAAWDALRAGAKRERSIGARSNGELGVMVTEDFPVDKVMFFSPFDSSNDFSVAGILTRQELSDVSKQ